MCSSYNGNLISIDDLAVEDSSKKRDLEKGALFSLFKTIGTRFDIHLSVFARVDETESGNKKIQPSCFKINKFLEMSE